MRPYKTALVLGLASSGEAAARLLLSEGAQVLIADGGDSEILRRRAAALQALGAEVRLGAAAPAYGDFEIAIVSPGIPVTSDMVKAVAARGIPVVSEVELGWSRFAGRVLAVSGSNGKSTLVKLCAEALALAGRQVAIAGNYGPPASAVVRAGKHPDWLVLEISSFQLETVQAFRPDVGVLLNVTPNHLDRHGDFKAYRQLKSRLFARMAAADTGITDPDILPEIRALAGSPNRWVTAGVHPAADFFYQPGAIHVPHLRKKINLSGTIFDNEVMGLTAAAAAAALSACEVEASYLAAAARAFQPLPHRLQNVADVRGVKYIDDSKATNLAAMMAALRMTPRPIRLIAGGLSKHEPYEPARILLGEKVISAHLIGQAAETMARAWRGAVPCVINGTLAQAVAEAARQAVPGDTVLLSPGCASFDQFHNFEERGERFISAIQALS